MSCHINEYLINYTKTTANTGLHSQVTRWIQSTDF